MAKTKKEIEVQLDEDGISVETKKKIDWKSVGKKVLYHIILGAGCAFVGVITYIAVGGVMVDNSDNGSCDSDGGDGSDSSAEADASDTSVAD